MTTHIRLNTNTLRNNLTRILKALIDRELIELRNDGTYDIADPMLKIWFRQSMM